MSPFNLSQLHFLRPEWLLALIPVVLFAWLLLRRKLFSHSWQSVVDARLLPHLLIGKPGRRSRLPVMFFVAVGTLVTIALAGPTWNKLPQPVFRQQSALIIGLDLSRSMDATDISPSRLARARYKIADILTLRKEGQTALIAYAASAFTVTPLTDDADTIGALVPSLASDIMPAQGSRPDLALNKAMQLFSNSGIKGGDILLITDRIDEQYLPAFAEVAEAGHRVSILATGTANGAPIALANGGFLKDAQGAIVIPRLDINQLRSVALSTGGRFSVLTADDGDINHLLAPLTVDRLDMEAQQTEMQADVWRDQGPWLLLLVIPLAALAFRRGYLVFLLILTLPYAPPADASVWDHLWNNSNQLGAEKFARKQHREAADYFTDPEWQAAAHYRAGEYEQALHALQGLDTADAAYNRANALARLGRLQDAIDAYNQALQKDPDHEDAAYNKKLLEQHQQNSQQQRQDSEKGSGDQKDEQPAQQSNGAQPPSSDETESEQDTGEKDQRTQANDDKPGQARDRPGPDTEQGGPPRPSQTQRETRQEPADPEGGQQQGPTDEQQILSQQATEQWLRRIPDDPGGLLRRKFKYQYQRQNQQPNETQPW